MMNEEVLKAFATLAAAYAQQPAKASDSEVTLGFCDPPKSASGIAIYIDDEEGLFYEFHSDRPKREQKQFIEKRALACKITRLRLATKDFEGTDNLKLRLDVMADKPITIEKGLTTNFTRGLVFSLARLGVAVKEVVTIEISVPQDLEKKTCFCNVYDSLGQKISPQSRYGSESDFEKIQVASAEISRILKERKTFAKSQVEDLKRLQAQEEEILSSLVEQINQNLR